MTDYVNGLKSLSGSRRLTCEASDFLYDAAEEIVRLRLALEKIAKDPPSNLDEPDLDWEVIAKLRLVARKALHFPRLVGSEEANG